MGDTLNLFPARVPIGTVDQNGQVIATPEFSRALTGVLQRLGGPSGIGNADLEVLANISPPPAVDMSQFIDLGAQQLTGLTAMLAEANKAISDLQSQIIESASQVAELRKQIDNVGVMAGYTDPFRVNWERPGTIGSLTSNSGSFTRLSVSGQITSTLATGTAPFVVASATNVPNLNASSLNGATFASPGAIGSGTAGSGAFTSLSCTGNLTAGTTSAVGGAHTIRKDVAEGSQIMEAFSGTGGADSLIVYSAAANGFNAANTVLKVARNTGTLRSINAGGTVNASGADYAEYMHKSPGCGVVRKGDVIGIDRNGQITDRWADAIRFAIKSTDPSYVGADTWADDLPEPLPLREGASFRSLRKHARKRMAWAHRFEARRVTVDRVAFSGQVPVNVLGAEPGDYLIPVRIRDGISVVPVTMPSLEQYMQAVGSVIAIEQDGRARVIVKIG